MSEPSGIDLLRETVVSRSRMSRFLQETSRALDLHPEALFQFARGATLAPNVLRRLAEIVYGGALKYDDARDRLHPTERS